MWWGGGKFLGGPAFTLQISKWLPTNQKKDVQAECRHWAQFHPQLFERLEQTLIMLQAMLSMHAANIRCVT